MLYGADFVGAVVPLRGGGRMHAGMFLCLRFIAVPGYSDEMLLISLLLRSVDFCGGRKTFCNS